MRAVIRVLSWNVGSLQTNPLEFWQPVGSTVRGVQDKLDRALRESKSTLMRDVFTESMLRDIPGYSAVFQTIHSEFATRSLHAFITDPLIGHKRLVSMPDRVMREFSPFGKRPSLITGYSEPFSSMEHWWAVYLEFMKTVDPLYSVLRGYQTAKYGTSVVSENEIANYKEYQLVYLVAADAALTFLGLRAPEMSAALSMMNSVFARKFEIIYHHLRRHDADVVCLQEVDVSELMNFDFADYISVLPQRSSGKQDSVILLRASVFTQVEPIEHDLGGIGDLTLVGAVHTATGRRLRIASYHGDTNGQSTIPTITTMLSGVLDPFVIGIDANTHAKSSPGKLAFDDFKAFIHDSDLRLCNAAGSPTTMSARSFFQAQSHKGSHASDFEVAADPKDNIIITRDFQIADSGVDFTGERNPDPRLIPNEGFPSDHAIVWAQLELAAQNSEL